MSRAVLLPAVIACVVAAALFVPFLAEDRELVAATPSPRPLFQLSLVEIGPREQLCISDVTIPADADQLRFQVGTFGRPGPELAVTLQARGYRERSSVPGGYADNALVASAMRPPAGDRLGTVCIADRGRRPIALAGTAEERTQSRPEGRIGGAAVPADVYLAFYQDGSASALERVPEIVDRMSAFRPGVVAPWLLWPLLALVVMGVPAGVVFAALRAARP
jgi:hypothetical protein